jgi:hypothetical protein
MSYSGGGTVWCNGADFLQLDSLTTGKRTYYSKTVYNKNELLFLDYGKKELSAVTKE